MKLHHSIRYHHLLVCCYDSFGKPSLQRINLESQEGKPLLYEKSSFPLIIVIPYGGLRLKESMWDYIMKAFALRETKFPDYCLIPWKLGKPVLESRFGRPLPSNSCLYRRAIALMISRLRMDLSDHLFSKKVNGL